MSTRKFFLVHHFHLGSSRAISWGLLCVIGVWLFAPGDALSQSSVQRDQQALTILTQAIAAGGGSQLLGSIRDINETGKITYHKANSSNIRGDVSVKGRGLHQLKIEADLATGKRTTVVNGYGGSLIEVDGRRTPIHGQSAGDIGSFTLPWLPLIAAMHDSSTSIIYEGLVAHNGTSAHDIRFQRVYTKQQDPQGNRGEREARDVYIDPSTFLIAAVSDRIFFGGLKGHGLTLEDLYSDYQSNSGIMMPLTIAQTVGGEIKCTINLDHVTINTGLADADFTW